MMHMSPVLKLIAAVFFLSILPAQVHALTPAQVFDKVKDAAVVVKTLDAQGEVKAQGSGVLLPSGRVATNCHVVEGGTFYQMGRGKQLVFATLYAEDGDKDICLLDAKGIEGKPAELGKAAALKVGDPVYAVGAPQGLELSLSDGIVAQLRYDLPPLIQTRITSADAALALLQGRFIEELPPLIQTTAAISPGSSGGGLFDREGRLVGLTTLYIEGGQNLNFAMPVEWIEKVKPGRTPASEGHSHTEWWKRVAALRRMEDWQGLLEWCGNWTKSEPENADAWVNFGNAHYHLKRYNDAIEAYRQAIKIDPEHTMAWYGLGTAYVDLSRFNEAVDAFRQVVRIDPDNALSWYGLGLAYNLSGNKTAALGAVRELRPLDPERADALFNVIMPR
jgi:hypothetical protein